MYQRTKRVGSALVLAMLLAACGGGGGGSASSGSSGGGGGGGSGDTTTSARGTSDGAAVLDQAAGTVSLGTLEYPDAEYVSVGGFTQLSDDGRAVTALTVGATTYATQNGVQVSQPLGPDRTVLAVRNGSGWGALSALSNVGISAGAAGMTWCLGPDGWLSLGASGGAKNLDAASSAEIAAAFGGGACPMWGSAGVRQWASFEQVAPTSWDLDVVENATDGSSSQKTVLSLPIGAGRTLTDGYLGYVPTRAFSDQGKSLIAWVDRSDDPMSYNPSKLHVGYTSFPYGASQAFSATADVADIPYGAASCATMSSAQGDPRSQAVSALRSGNNLLLLWSQRGNDSNGQTCEVYASVLDATTLATRVPAQKINQDDRIAFKVWGSVGSNGKAMIVWDGRAQYDGNEMQLRYAQLDLGAASPVWSAAQPLNYTGGDGTTTTNAYDINTRVAMAADGAVTVAYRVFKDYVSGGQSKGQDAILRARAYKPVTGWSGETVVAVAPSNEAHFGKSGSLAWSLSAGADGRTTVVYAVPRTCESADCKAYSRWHLYAADL